MEHKNTEEKKETHEQNNIQTENTNELKIKELEKQLEEKENKLKDMIDQAQRIKAEFDNFRKRIEKERAMFHEIGKEHILLDLIPISFHLEQAIDHTKEQKADVNEDKNINTVIDGIKLILKDIEKIFEKNNLKRKTVLGEQFDPNFREAVLVEEREDKKDNTILKELSPCYLKDDKVLNHAKVVITKKKEITHDQKE